jgi:hypothetical protein
MTVVKPPPLPIFCAFSPDPIDNPPFTTTEPVKDDVEGVVFIN